MTIDVIRILAFLFIVFLYQKFQKLQNVVKEAEVPYGAIFA